MGKIHLPKHLGYRELGESIVDILTIDEKRTSVWTTQFNGIKNHKPIGINSVTEKGTISFGGDLYERGFINPEGRIFYI